MASKPSVAKFHRMDMRLGPDGDFQFKLYFEREDLSGKSELLNSQWFSMPASIVGSLCVEMLKTSNQTLPSEILEIPTDSQKH